MSTIDVPKARQGHTQMVYGVTPPSSSTKVFIDPPLVGVKLSALALALHCLQKNIERPPPIQRLWRCIFFEGVKIPTLMCLGGHLVGKSVDV
ncbi:hypothetical protein V6N11_028977 [Hibiscus sabdariffa]|uniref:Uncharacterized protein n=2 Tax=Hibiscus sabdariffa TaxID=183260 RepID=A0ABR2NWG0_9ROSI